MNAAKLAPFTYLRQDPGERVGAAPAADLGDDAEVSEDQGAARAVGDGAVTLTRRFARRVHRAASADGAGRSGLAALIATHALQAAGDALVAVSLASTAFFEVSAEAARGKIALYLLLTLLPFSFLIPVAGPLLDRFPHGRRNVLAAATGGRGLVAWTLAGSITSLALYPQALAILILARAYGVARSAAVVRVRPPALGLVASNARLNIAATAAGGIAAAVGFGISTTLGTPWVLRLATVLFLAAAVASLRLPDHVDGPRPAGPDDSPHATASAHAPRTRRRRRPVAAPYSLGSAPAVVRRALVAVVSLRVITGLLTLGLAILLKAHDTRPIVVALILGAAVAGGLCGTLLASHLPPERITRLTAFAVLAPIVGCLLAAVGGSVPLKVLAVGLTGFGAALGKYALDASLQTHVPSSQVGGAFARSETALQLGWALGGGLGLALSLIDSTPLGASGAAAVLFGVATVIPAAGVILGRRWAAAAPA